MTIVWQLMPQSSSHGPASLPPAGVESAQVADTTDGTDGGKTINMPLVLGLSIGIGVPVVIALAVVVVILAKKKDKVAPSEK